MISNVAIKFNRSPLILGHKLSHQISGILSLKHLSKQVTVLYSWISTDFSTTYTFIYTAMASMKCTLLLCQKCNKKTAGSLRNRLYGRGSKIRTHNKGFGDPRVTITPCPYVLSNRVYYTGKLCRCQGVSFQERG